MALHNTAQPEPSRYTAAEVRSLCFEQAESPVNRRTKYFWRSLAVDEQLLDIASQARPNPVMPWVFLMLVRYLGTIQADVKIQHFIDSLYRQKYVSKDYAYFHSYCLQNESNLIWLLSTRRVQTNTLVRSAALLPAYCLLAREFPGRPWTFFDLGTSAGLNLIWDLYSYAYPELGGRVKSSRFEDDVDIEIEFSWYGNKPANLKAFFESPTITKRIGLDLEPIDLSVPAQRQWLAAFNQLDDDVVNAFLYLKDQVDCQLIAGDVNDCLTPLAQAVPANELLVMNHSFTTIQFSAQAKIAFNRILAKIGELRDLAIISIENELTGTRPAELWLQTYRAGQYQARRLAVCEQVFDVGSSFEWLGPVT